MISPTGEEHDPMHDHELTILITPNLKNMKKSFALRASRSARSERIKARCLRRATFSFACLACATRSSLTLGTTRLHHRQPKQKLNAVRGRARPCNAAPCSAGHASHMCAQAACSEPEFFHRPSRETEHASGRHTPQHRPLKNTRCTQE